MGAILLFAMPLQLLRATRRSPNQNAAWNLPLLCPLAAGYRSRIRI